MVVKRGVNEHEVIPLLNHFRHTGIILRFIEFMPLDGDQHWTQQAVVSEQQILAQLQSRFDVQMMQGQGANPARSYTVNGRPIGIISTITNSFCSSCDRLRLNAQGEFYNCLFARQGLNLKAEIELLSSAESAAESALQQRLSSYIWRKEQGFHAIQRQANNSRKISMHMIGG